jgi:hypothetical protein
VPAGRAPVSIAEVSATAPLDVGAAPRPEPLARHGSAQVVSDKSRSTSERVIRARLARLCRWEGDRTRVCEATEENAARRDAGAREPDRDVPDTA